MTDDAARAQHFFGHYKEATLEGFKKFHAENPHIYARFVLLAKQMKATGRKKYSARLIFHAMRWEQDLKTNAEPFKINDRWLSIYSRLLAYYQPEFEDFFEFRVRGHSDTPYTEEDFV